MNGTPRILLTGATVVAAALTLSACTSGPVSVSGTWGKPDVRGEPSLVLEDDGSLSGSDGCNRLFGDYTVDGDRVEFGVIGSTMMFCEGVDTWLSAASTARVDGDRLVVSDESGAEIGTLDRA